MSLYFRWLKSTHERTTSIITSIHRIVFSQAVIQTTNFSTALISPCFSPKMKLQVLVAALAAMAMAHHPPGLKEKCGRLGVKEWDPDNLPEGYKLEDIKKCAEFPLEVGYYWGFGEH
ncbi:hypothetical protein CEP54_005612 [Fusarium duplospermum]|uniref:Uncharacterized protein n=1 Tax=Fusarium duplospermum TaxID=1325734 RepID=A0A428QBL8_9HYPO|nr:hypothetical protein CEP54_005612 [Fusarium duplospermum]